ncbi:MAG: hypothetical protein KA715_14325 [Xanthomonadaceae bacterium]|nr:hypothetical protein [Xanthomonadaceae bacterium]
MSLHYWSWLSRFEVVQAGALKKILSAYTADPKLEDELPIIELPSQEDIEQKNRFTVYLNYLTAICGHLLKDGYHNTEQLKTISETSGFKSIKGRSDVDLEQVARLLRNSWFTELQIRIAGKNADFVSYANHWVAVQAYYSNYLAIRGLFAAMGNGVTREHAKNLKAIGELIKVRPTLFPDPWCIACVGNPDKNIQYINIPHSAQMNPKAVSALTSGDRVDFYNSFALFLKTTRTKQIEQLCIKWKTDNRKARVSPSAKQSIVDALPPTTIFNCLFRLRIRSNYEDADSFLLSVESATEAKAFHRALRVITWQSLFILEMLIARHIGKKNFENIVNSFLAHDKKHNYSKNLIQRRWAEIKGFW